MLGIIASIMGMVREFLPSLFAYKHGKAKAENEYAKKELKKINKDLQRLSKRPHTRADTHELLDKWIRIIDSSTD